MKKRNLLALLLSLVMLLSVFTSCANKQTSASIATTPTQTTAPPTTTQIQATKRTVTDSCGRKVEIPANITKIAPSGALAQIVLFSIAPYKLVGLSGDFADVAKKYIDKKYYSLPTFGQFYGKNVNLNIEALAAAKPDVIIDIGEAKATVKADMDGIQAQTGIPVIFIEATLPTMANAYITLGDILSEKEQAQKLSDYCAKTIAAAKEKSAFIADKDKVKLYYAEGETGLATNPVGSIHADVIDMIGAINVADLKNTSGSGGNEVSLEQVMLWAPDVMLFGPNSIYSTVSTDASWKDFKAVKNNKIYEVPLGPYNWMGRPPAVNRLLGVKWLGNLLYPETYKYDMVKETKTFYELFYHCTISDDDAKTLMAHSTFKK
jgi:iron complex transport system substrate-binding protein